MIPEVSSADAQAMDRQNDGSEDPAGNGGMILLDTGGVLP